MSILPLYRDERERSEGLTPMSHLGVKSGATSNDTRVPKGEGYCSWGKFGQIGVIQIDKLQVIEKSSADQPIMEGRSVMTGNK